MTVEGVLQAENGQSVVPEGARLYYALADHYRLIIVSDTDNSERLAHWLKINGLTAHVQQLTRDKTDLADKPQRRVNQIGRIRAEGAPIGLVIDPDPSVVKATMLAGMPSLLFAHPRYARPSFRPDFTGALRPWDEITSEMERQNEIRYSDTRKVFNE